MDQSYSIVKNVTILQVEMHTWRNMSEIDIALISSIAICAIIVRIQNVLYGNMKEEYIQTLPFNAQNVIMLQKDEVPFYFTWG